MIKVFFVSNKDFFLRAIEPLLIKENILITGICRDPKQAIEDFESSGADLIVMDANWNAQELSGINILKKFLDYDKSIKVILVTNSYEEKLAERLKSIGAMGYFYRHTDDAADIVTCISNVYFGESCFIRKS